VEFSAVDGNFAIELDFDFILRGLHCHSQLILGAFIYDPNLSGLRKWNPRAVALIQG